MLDQDDRSGQVMYANLHPVLFRNKEHCGQIGRSGLFCHFHLLSSYRMGEGSFETQEGFVPPYHVSLLMGTSSFSPHLSSFSILLLLCPFLRRERKKQQVSSPPHTHTLLPFQRSWEMEGACKAKHYFKRHPLLQCE